MTISNYYNKYAKNDYYFMMEDEHDVYYLFDKGMQIMPRLKTKRLTVFQLHFYVAAQSCGKV